MICDYGMTHLVTNLSSYKPQLFKYLKWSPKEYNHNINFDQPAEQLSTQQSLTKSDNHYSVKHQSWKVIRMCLNWKSASFSFVGYIILLVYFPL